VSLTAADAFGICIVVDTPNGRDVRLMIPWSSVSELEIPLA
jgi:hypothetical protein